VAALADWRVVCSQSDAAPLVSVLRFMIFLVLVQTLMNTCDTSHLAFSSWLE
jgi:hypothetical protein